jgi:peroxin-7
MHITRYKTDRYQGYSCEFSPFYAERLAIGTSSNFGIVGTGRLWILNLQAGVERMYDTQDGIFDVAWSEQHNNQLITGCGDGSIQLWDTTLPVLKSNPGFSCQEMEGSWKRSI